MVDRPLRKSTVIFCMDFWEQKVIYLRGPRFEAPFEDFPRDLLYLECKAMVVRGEDRWEHYVAKQSKPFPLSSSLSISLSVPLSPVFLFPLSLSFSTFSPSYCTGAPYIYVFLIRMFAFNQILVNSITLLTLSTLDLAGAFWITTDLSSLLLHYFSRL